MLPRVSAAFAVAILSLSATGCGLKGPLYSPDERKATVGAEPATEPSTVKRRTPVVPPAPQAQKVPQDETSTSSSGSQPPVEPPDPDRPADAQPSPPPDR
jgi:predicted small lipoprotein YifL